MSGTRVSSPIFKFTYGLHFKETNNLIILHNLITAIISFISFIINLLGKLHHANVHVCVDARTIASPQIPFPSECARGHAMSTCTELLYYNIVQVSMTICIQHSIQHTIADVLLTHNFRRIPRPARRCGYAFLVRYVFFVITSIIILTNIIRIEKLLVSTILEQTATHLSTLSNWKSPHHIADHIVCAHKRLCIIEFDAMPKICILHNNSVQAGRMRTALQLLAESMPAH